MSLTCPHAASTARVCQSSQCDEFTLNLRLLYCQRHQPGYPNLDHRVPIYGLWMFQLRQAYREGTLSDVHITAMEKVIGWRWQNPAEEAWLAQYQRVLALKKADSWPNLVDPADLKIWLAEQRYQSNWGLLSPIYRQLFDDLEGWLWHLPEPLLPPPAAPLSSAERCELASKMKPLIPRDEWLDQPSSSSRYWDHLLTMRG